jgi:hypothetical protein
MEEQILKQLFIKAMTNKKMLTLHQKAVEYFKLRGIRALEIDQKVYVQTPDANQFALEITKEEVNYRAKLYDECMVTDIYLGLAGKVGHDAKLVKVYNSLLDKYGAEWMLTQVERWADDRDIKSIVSSCMALLYENKMISSEDIDDYLNTL